MKCQNVAVVRYTWPGQDESYACIEHAAQIKGAAEAMGFHLQFIPIGAPTRGEVQIVQCQQEVSDVRD